MTGYTSLPRRFGGLLLLVLLSRWGTLAVLAGSLALAWTTAVFLARPADRAARLQPAASFTRMINAGHCPAPIMVRSADGSTAAYVSPVTCP